MVSDLPAGLYEALLTRRLDHALQSVTRDSVQASVESADPADVHVLLARHVHDLLLHVLRSLPQEDRVRRQTEIVNALLASLAHQVAAEAPALQDESVLDPARLLLALYGGGTALAAATAPPRPEIPLSSTTLLVNGPQEPAVGHAIRQEIASADEIDLLCAFVRWHGVRILADEVQRHLRAGKPLRILTSTYMGVTERRALDQLANWGAQIKVCYETQSTRLHAKAWLFRRRSGFSTAYVGSSNLSKSALLDGLEWNVRLSAVDLAEVLEKFRATFESYWEDDLFESYAPGRDAERFDRAVGVETAVPAGGFVPIHIDPFPHQRRILYELEAERERHGRWRNLVVAATGTGKTIVAALDYRRLREAWGDAPLLFVAHRRELLQQSLQRFRMVLADGSFGELYVDGQRPERGRHVFASVQSLQQVDLAGVPPDAFAVVIVDEFHHAAAPTYRRLLEHFRPRLLLGLTATPERADGQGVTGWFDGHVASELRLWEALESGILCPFQYFGVHDDVDLSQVAWRRGGYEVAELERVYTGNDARVLKIVAEIRRKVADPLSMRALGFCVSVAHAEYMARRFRELGIPAVAVSGQSTSDQRDAALSDLKSRRVNVVFAVDLFNEGVDVPEIDTVVFLRPTESVTVFLQQLGRGLRRTDGKCCLTVLDFIGQQHRRFRFDRRLAALGAEGSRSMVRQIESGFPFLPAGCFIDLDPVVRSIVLANVRHALGSNWRELADELRATGDVRLGEFLARTEVGLDRVCGGQRGGWAALRREAGLATPAPGPDEERLARALGRLTHIDDPERIGVIRAWVQRRDPPDASALDERRRRMLGMLVFSLWGVGKRPPDFASALARLWQHPALLQELDQILEVLDERAAHIPRPLRTPGAECVPIAVHGRYSRDEILSAYGVGGAEGPPLVQAGVYYDQPSKTDLFFVTLHKSEKEFSPTTRYRDYAVSPTVFHWESQGRTTTRSEAGNRYVRHGSLGSSVVLFARERKDLRSGETCPYLCLGPATYLRHEGERPMAIHWRLEVPLPEDFFHEARVAAG